MATQGLMSSQIADMLQSGMSPQEIRQQMQNSQAMDFAKLTPNQQMSYNINRSVGGFADSLLGAFGVNQEDPTLAKASLLAQIRNEIDPTDEKSIIKGAQKLAKLGFLQEAQTQAAKALAMREKEATISAKTAEKLTPEERNAAAIVNKMPNILSGSPQWNEEFKKQLERLTAKGEGKINYGAETERISKAQFNKPYSELTQEQAAKVDKIVEQRDLSSSAAKASKPVDIASIIKEIGTKEDVKGKSDIWKAAGDAYKTQVPMIEKLKEVRNNLPATFTGSFSETALQFGKALSAFGVPVDENKLSNTEYMNSVSSQVLQTIARNFPGSLAVKEMDQLVKSKFSSPQQIKTISRILSDLQTEIEAGTKSYEQLAKLPETERYSKDLNLLTGQNYSKLKRYRALEDKARSLKPGQTMTKAEVEEAKKLQQELGA